MRAQQMPPLSPNALTLPAKGYTIPFVWQGDSTAAGWEPHAAMLLPVKLPHCPKTFYMQFDLGSASTLFYTAKVKAIRERYPQSLPADTAQGFSFTAGKMPVAVKTILQRPNGSGVIHWKDKASIDIIGTIGADFLDGRVLVIDYPAQKIYNGEALPAALAKKELNPTPFYFNQRSVLLPAVLHGKKTLLFFDTGSSAYSLLTDSATCASLASPNTAERTYPVKAFYGEWTAHTVQTADSISIGSQFLPLGQATYMGGVGAQQVAQMKRLGIGGMTGNRLFLQQVLVLDGKGKKFGIVKSK